MPSSSSSFNSLLAPENSADSHLGSHPRPAHRFSTSTSSQSSQTAKATAQSVTTPQSRSATSQKTAFLSDPSKCPIASAEAAMKINMRAGSMCANAEGRSKECCNSIAKAEAAATAAESAAQGNWYVKNCALGPFPLAPPKEGEPHFLDPVAAWVGEWRERMEKWIYGHGGEEGGDREEERDFEEDGQEEDREDNFAVSSSRENSLGRRPEKKSGIGDLSD